MPGTEYIIKYIDDISEVIQGTKRIETLNRDLVQNTQAQFGQISRVIGQSTEKVFEKTGAKGAINTFKQLGTVVETTDGKFQEITRTQQLVNGQFKTVSGSVKDVTSQFARTSVETAKASKNTKTLSENIGQLAKRAILTIPLWLVLRGAIMGTFKVIKDGLKTIEDQDRAWQKAKRTLSGSTQDIARNFEKLREETTKLSLETGESIEKITNAFYKFSTVGFDFETSMKGATYATKTAILMFGDAEETANAFARAMRVLVDTSAGAKPAGDQIAEAMALTSELWKDNAFELSEFTQSLEKFAGTAKATNFTTQQTIALLASLSTAGLRGGRAGTLLRSSIVKLLSNLDKLSGTLGVKVNPQLDSTFDVLMRVLDAVQGLDEGSQVAEQTANAIGKIFGGVRGMEAVLALKALREEMLKNIDTMGGVEKLNEEFEDMNKTLSRQLAIYHNLNKEIGKSLVSKTVGADDFAGAIEDINTTKLPVLKEYLDEIGEILNSLLKYNLSAPVGIFIDGIIKARKETAKLLEDITKGLKGELSREQLIDILAKIKVKNFDISPQAIEELEKKLQEKTTGIKVEVEVKAKSVQYPVRELAPEETQNIAKLILDVELDRLKTLGATNSQLLKAEDLYNRQLGIEEDSLDKIKRRLELEKSINEEKRVQNRLGSDSIKLFEIAQTEGEDMAKKVSEALADKETFQRVLRIGGETAELLRKEFADKVQQVEAEQFFRGERVARVPELRGGRQINIEEEAIRGGITNLSKVLLDNLKAQREFQRLEGGEVKIVRPDKVEIIGTTPEGFAGAKNVLGTNEDWRRINIENVASRVIPQENLISSENKIDINFREGTFVIHGQTLEEQQKEINKAFINLGTPGTKENQQLNKAITGNKQTPVL